MRPVVIALLAVLALPAVAAAQPGPDDPTPPGMTPPIKPPPGPESPLDLADHRDAAADRAFGSSTALVVPRGTVDLSVRFGKGVLIGSAAVGLGSSAELSADLAGGDQVGMIGAALKIAVVRERTFGLAIEGGFHVGSNDSSQSEPTVWSGGIAASLCTDDQCSALLSGTVGTLAASGQATAYGTASLLVGTGGFRPILEVAAASGGGLGFLGFRVGGRNIALDAGFLVAALGEGGAAEPVFGLTIRP